MPGAGFVGRTRSALLVALACAASTGCARTAFDRGLGWTRVLTDHVRLTTDAEPARAEAAVRTLEAHERALDQELDICGARRVPPMDVVLLTHGEDFHVFDPAGHMPMFVPPRIGLFVSPSRVVLRASGGELDPASVQGALHASVHRRVVVCAPALPRWIAEGLAEYFETLRARDHERWVGIAPYRFAHGTYEVTSAADGLAITHVSSDALTSSVLARDPAEYATDSCAFRPSSRAYGDDPAGWAIVHWLFRGTGDDLRAAFTGYLADVPTDHAPPRALADALRSSSLRTELDAHVLHAPHSSVTPFEPGEIRVDPELLDVGEADLLWASLLVPGRLDREVRMAEEHVALALRESENAPRVVVGSLALITHERPDREVIDELAARFPHDLDVLRARATSAPRDARTSNEAAWVLREMTGRHDLHAADRVALAALASRLGRHRASLDEALAAVEQAPAEWWTHAILAYALRIDGDEAGSDREAYVAALAAPPSDAGVHVLLPELSAMAPSPTGPAPPPVTTARALDVTHVETTGGIGSPTLSSRAFEERCVGRVLSAPALVVDIPASDEVLVIHTDAPVLVVRASDGSIRCTSDRTEGAALAEVWPPGRLEVFVGAWRAMSTLLYDVWIAPPIPPPTDVRPGARVVLHRHAAAEGIGAPSTATNWAAPMDAFVGQTALVVANAGNDELGFPGVRVDVDGGEWFWRVRDLTLAP